MATIKEQNENNKALARTAQTDLAASLTATGLGVDLIAVIVPVQYAVTVQANPASGKTIEEIRQIAADNNFTLYEP